MAEIDQPRPLSGPRSTQYPPLVESLEDARFWIAVLWRWACQDAARLAEAHDRLARLERPWWRRWRRG